MLTEKERTKLFIYAKRASKMSYCPYSKFAVGAAVLTNKNKIYLGANIENASYGLTLCAERVAICNAISNGFRNIIAVAVAAKRGEASPCGACRQFILEFGKNIEVIFKKNNELVSETIEELIPKAFTKGNLK